GRLVEWAYAAGWRLTQALPERVAAALFRAGADMAVRRGGKGVAQIEAILRRVVGPDMPDTLVRDAIRSYGRYWLEAFRLPGRSREEHQRGFVLHGGHLLHEAHAAGAGAVVALPHAGNWDAAGAWVVANGSPLVTVAQRLKPEGLYRRFLAYREKLGMVIVPSSGGPRPVMDALIDGIRDQAAVVPLLADRALAA